MGSIERTHHKRSLRRILVGSLRVILPALKYIRRKAQVNFVKLSIRNNSQSPKSRITLFSPRVTVNPAMDPHVSLETSAPLNPQPPARVRTSRSKYYGCHGRVPHPSRISCHACAQLSASSVSQSPNSLARVWTTLPLAPLVPLRIQQSNDPDRIFLPQVQPLNDFRILLIQILRTWTSALVL